MTPPPRKDVDGAELAAAVVAGERRAVARALTWVENERDEAAPLLAALFPHTGRAHIVGVTGAPGTGKSTLVGALAAVYRSRGQTVGILAIDPTSPFSGGALLGDRVRMGSHSGDSGVFIRSMATRGSLGGLARAARDAVRVLDAAGFDVVLVETVGAGQSEVDIARAAQTTLVVEVPGLGDDIQTIKAGLLEIADIFVVNKADRPGADNTVRALRAMLELGHPASRAGLLRHHGRLIDVPVSESNGVSGWQPPVLPAVATTAAGLTELLAALDAHRAYLHEDEQRVQLETQQIEIELHDRLRAAFMSRLLQNISGERLAAIIASVQARQMAPQQAVEIILNETELE